VRLSLFLSFLLSFAPLFLSKTTASNGLDTLGSPLTESINSPYNEAAPVLSANGLYLYFSRKGHPQNMGEDNNSDVWVAYRPSPSALWQRAVSLGAPINNDEDNTIVGTNLYGTSLYYTTNNPNFIFCSHKKGRSWGTPYSIPIRALNNKGRQLHASMSMDENVLLIAMQGEETFGGNDIYVSFKDTAGIWSRPQNVGATINGGRNEAKIILAADNETIYFASNRQGTIGGLDWWMSRRTDATWTNWTTPVNLGVGVNTSGDDTSLAVPVLGNYAIVASSESGSLNLVEVKLREELRPYPTFLVEGKIKILDKNVPTELKIQCQITKGKEKYVIGNEFKNSQNYQFLLPRETNALIYAQNELFFSNSIFMPASGKIKIELDGSSETNTLTKEEIKIERLQIRITQLNEELSEISTRPFSNYSHIDQFDFSKIQKSNYERDLALEKIKQRYEKKITGGANNPQEDENRLSTERFDTDALLEINTSARIEPRAAPTTTNEPDTAFLVLRQRFNRYHEQRIEVSKPAVPTSSPSPTLSREEREAIEAARESEHLSEPTFHDFEQFTNYVRKNLREKLSLSIREELQERILYETANQLEKQFTNEEKELLKGKFREAKEQVQKQLDLNLKTSKAAQQRPSSLNDERLIRLENELERKLEDAVKNELRVVFKDELRYEIRQRLELILKQELRADLQKELIQTLRKEAKAIKGGGNSNSINSSQNLHNSTTQDSLHTSSLGRLGAVFFSKAPSKELVLYPLEAGQLILLPNLLFRSNRIEPQAVALLELDRITQFLQKHPSLFVSFLVHTNGHCSYKFADELTHNRAQFISDYFLSKGIPSERVLVNSYGRNKPITTNDSDEGRVLNQRVEMQLLRR
jgi:outer membrane protein OmpA-like peptidoglycan-associated protein